MSEKDQNRRFFILMAVLAAAALILIGRFAWIMIVERAMAGDSEETITLPDVERGPILDRNGRILAIQTRHYSVTAWTPYIRDPQVVAEGLSPLVGLEPGAILERLQSRDGFVYIARQLSSDRGEPIRSLLADTAYRGIDLVEEYGRTYPAGRLASHVVGYVNIDNTGLDGTEYSLNDFLFPQTVGLSRRRIYGNQVFLTLDQNIQYFAEESARTAMEEHEAASVMVMVMDARNGDILAWSSLPDFDPNAISGSTENDRMNRPIRFDYEPGSVFKIFSIAAMLDRGAIGTDDTFYCDGAYHYTTRAGETIRIGCQGVHGSVNAQQILKLSCNAGAAYASENISSADLAETISLFGFGAPTGISLPGESGGLVNPVSRWSVRSKPTIAFGQELSVTALQVVSAATVFTNGGELLRPRLVRRIVSQDGEVLHAFDREVVRRVISPETAGLVLDMMATATENGGSAWLAAVPGVRVSAKTGTAEIPDPVHGGYLQEETIASCLSILPTDDPRLILYAVVERPQGQYHSGARIAAPMLSELGDRILTYLGVPRAGETVVTHSGRIAVPDTVPAAIGDFMPDLTDYPKRLLLPLLDREDLRVRIEGDGWVVRQTPPPGTTIVPNMEIVLELE